MEPSYAIQVRDVDKRYTIRHERPTLAERLHARRTEHFYALRHINFSVRKGERIGIIGHNGAGKTTLLKIISTIATPTTGSVSTNGTISSLIDLEAGFHPDLSGLQNILIYGLLLGMSKEEIRRATPSIIRFAGLGKFIDVPFYTYSNGMQLRLGFSIVAHSKPDILLLDEFFAVGDHRFQTKAHRWLWQFIRQGKTVLLVSQNPDLLKRYCTKCIVMENGRIVSTQPIGKRSVTLSRYL